jgi:polyhydroxyalkanoate synthesis regulator phasin
MTPEEIKKVVQEVLSEQRIANKADLEEAAERTVATVLRSFGIEEDDRKEVKADFDHLRRWRKSVEQAKGFTARTVITTIAAGLLGAIWLGFQALLHK